MELSNFVKTESLGTMVEQDVDPVIVGGVLSLAPGTHTGKSLS